ncbi:tryptophan--tRNA ligase [Synechococcus sp. PCC 7336]|uniref:tryptophan--tRNA ligase n=1 Tax=Synechococcus sp. PCC 7336 TaxID=195250 RepID=UPI000347E3D0|nr:tryptophan--tRNA ligase [Synechococcus sp. PCC 7336]
MDSAEILRKRKYRHSLVRDFDSDRVLSAFLLGDDRPTLIFICQNNSDSSGTLPDLRDLERIVGMSLTVRDARKVEDGLAVVQQGQVQRVVLDESAFDREKIYLRSPDNTSALEISGEDFKALLEDLGFETESETARLRIYDFGYAAVRQSAQNRVVSGIQPSGDMTLGNYLGAVVNWQKQVENYDENFFFLADLHSLTTLPDPADLRDRIFKTVATLVACGLDLDKATLFRQSDLGGYHTELAWIFSCLTPEGRLEQMTQFKEKARKQEFVGSGLKTYPILMAADIAIYQATLVPVGEDQRQHLELAREIIRRFNGRYGYTMPVPKADMPQVLARVMSLTDGTSKMSKSNPNRDSCIYLLDNPDDIKRKIKRAKTDSNRDLFFDENRPEISNLLGIYQVLSGLAQAEVVEQFKGQGAAKLKAQLTEAVIEALRPIREQYDRLSADRDRVLEILSQGKARVEPIAQQTLAAVKQRVGL